MTRSRVDIFEAKDEVLRASFVALQRASRLARETAIRTGTHLVLVKDGKLLRIPAHELCPQPNVSVHEAPAHFILRTLDQAIKDVLPKLERSAFRIELETLSVSVFQRRGTAPGTWLRNSGRAGAV